MGGGASAGSKGFIYGESSHFLGQGERCPLQKACLKRLPVWWLDRKDTRDVCDLFPSYTLQSFRPTQVCNLGGLSLGSSAGRLGRLTYMHVCTSHTHMQIHTGVVTHLSTTELSGARVPSG